MNNLQPQIIFSLSDSNKTNTLFSLSLTRAICLRLLFFCGVYFSINLLPTLSALGQEFLSFPMYAVYINFKFVLVILTPLSLGRESVMELKWLDDGFAFESGRTQMSKIGLSDILYFRETEECSRTFPQGRNSFCLVGTHLDH